MFSRQCSVSFSVLVLCWFCIFYSSLYLRCSALSKVDTSVHNNLIISDNAYNIFWLIQITDLHISMFGHKDRETDLSEFCSTHIPVIQPELVIASGDITDGKGNIISVSSQNLEEWENYWSVLNQSGVLKLTKWFDIRGNHDAFDVPSWGADGDYYSHFGVKGQPSLKSYIFKLIKPYGQYSFISVDLTLEPGIKWPFNFFGSFNLVVKKQLLKSVSKSKGSNQTFIFGHHPTSTVVSNDLDIRSLIGDSAFAYLCGHLHTLHGLTKKMYYLQPQGYWEWELGDWRENRYYRIVAVDHDLVSFVDVRKSSGGSIKEWPIILITNPKNAQFSLPSKEPIYRIELSTHIRVLVWSLSRIQTVSISIDGIHLGNAKQANSLPGHNSTPLYVLPWNTSQWSSDPYRFHLIEITARDVNGNQRTVVQSFSFRSASDFPIGLLSKFMITVRLSVIIAALYYTIWIVIFILLILPLLLCRRPHLLICLFRTRLGKGMYQISSTKKLLYPVLIFMIYHISCPLFMGFLVADKFGFFFSFGIYIDGTYLPERLSYVLASSQLLGFGFYLLAFAVHCGKRQCDSMYALNTEPMAKYSDTSPHPNRDEIHSNAVYTHLPEIPFSPCMLITLITYIICHLTTTLIFVWLPFGCLTVLLSPGCVMPICVACILFHYCPRPDHVKHYFQ